MRKNILKKGIAYLCVLALAITMLFPSFDVYAQGEETNSGYDTIRVATMNLQVTEDTDMAEVNEVLEENKVDVVGLQEVDKENGRNNYDMLKALSDFGDYPYHFFQKAIDYKNGEYGIGIASKHELLDSDGANYEKGDVKEERAWERTHILYGDKEITVYNTHLTHESEAERKKELEELLKIFDADNSRYKVLTGDFNTDQGYYENYPFMRKYQTVNGHAGIWYDTCTEKEEDMKVAAIDNIIATRNLEIENIQTVSVDFSDHDMLYADLGFRDSDGVYFDLLNFLIDDAEKVDTSIYTDETMQMLQSALEKAKELDETVSQDEIDKSIKEIETAMEGLEVRNPNLALNKETTVSGCEIPEFGGEKAVDGIISDSSRWSAAKEDEQFWCVDLGEIYSISEVIIRFDGECPEYSVSVSEDGEQYTEVFSEKNGSETGETVTRVIQFAARNARYVRYDQKKMFTSSSNNKKYGSSFYEFEVYQEQHEKEETADEVIKQLEGVAPQISEDGKDIILPEITSENYEVKLYGSDNKQVIAMDGSIYQPLEDMTVNILYQVVNKNDVSDSAYTQKDIPVLIKGEYEKGKSDNEKPNVVPGLREWKGDIGNFELQDDSAIIIKDKSQETTAQMIQYYFSEMLSKDLSIELREPKKGDIYLKLNEEKQELGDEGYYLFIDDILTIEAPTLKGLQYGGTSVTQAMYQSEGKNLIAKGTARDYPKYEVRAGGFDVARKYVKLSYLEEIMKYMSWFKMNEIHVHVNDVMDNKDSAFRLESDIEGLTAEQSYTKDEYRAFQKEAQKYGMDVITEFDTPAHSGCFQDIVPELMYDWKHLDITKQETYDFIEGLLDEYLSSEDPVILSDTFHIGTDEYDKKFSEEMRKYTDHFINYVRDKGYNVRVWGSLGKNGFDGTTPVSNEATVNLWAPYWSDVQETFDAGYDIINTVGGWLYIVPGETHSSSKYQDYMDVEKTYNEWDVNNFKHARNNYLGTAIMQKANPQTKGAEFMLWNDYGGYHSGITNFDIMVRVKDSIAMVAEKTWYGEKTEGQTYEQYKERVDAVDNFAPGANPRRYVETQTDIIAEYDFSSKTDNIIKDLSGNGYDAVLHGATIEKGYDGNALTLDGEGYLSMPTESVGFPYTVSFDVKENGPQEENATLFAGEDGVMFAALSDSGKLGYFREEDSYYHDIELSEQWTNITMVCDQKDTTIYKNGRKISVAKNAGESQRNSSTTFVLPTEKIGEGFKGQIDNLTIFNRGLSAEEIAKRQNVDLNIGRNNLALGKNAEASSEYMEHQGAEKAVDGIKNIDEPVNENQSRWASERTDDQWLMVDLGDVYNVDEIRIIWEDAYAAKYKLLGSLDNQNWFEIKEIDEGNGGEEIHTKLDIQARYVKMQGIKMATKYGYSIYEFEVYKSAADDIADLIQKMETEMEQWDIGNAEGQISQAAYHEVIKRYDEIEEEISKLDSMTDEQVLIYMDEIVSLKNDLKNNIITETVVLSTEVLRYALKLAETVSTEGVIPSVVERFEKAKSNAETILNRAEQNDPTITQNQIDDSWRELISIMQYLSFKQGDKTDLEKVIALADEMYSDFSSYLEEGKELFLETLETAKAVQADRDALQTEVDTAWRELLTAMAGLQKIPDKTALGELLRKAEKLNENDYEKASFAAFQTAYANAKAVYENEQAVTADVNAAQESLKVAIAELVPAKDTDDNTVANAGNTTISSDKKDTNIPDTTNATKGTTTKSAKTGDETNAALPMAASLFAAVLMVVWKKKK